MSTRQTKRRTQRRGDALDALLLGSSAPAEAGFRGLVEVAPDAIVIVDRGGRIVLVNQQTEALFGYPREELRGLPVETLLPERFRGTHVGHRDAYVDAPRVRPMEANLELLGRRKDGSEFPLAISLGPLDINGELLVISTIRDITEQKQSQALIEAARQEAEAANHAKSEFLSRMSHELRTPLNAILGFGQLLQIDELSVEQRDSVDHVVRAGRHLLGLINDVLDISRIETGGISLSLEPVALNDVVRETRALVRPLAQEHRVRLEEDLEPTDHHVLADRQRLRQVLLNIVANGVKYNRHGGTVRVVCSAIGDRLRISVVDTGPGIAPAMLPRLFTAFDRLGAEQGQIEGTGLGLSLSKRLVEAMGGTLGVVSVLDEGTTFWLELPATESRLAAEALSVPIATFGDQRDAGPTRVVLYIEDNVDSAQLMERVMARLPGVRLISTMQGRMGIDLARQHRPDVILLDLHLPDMLGIDVLKAMRADPELRATPVLVASADATPGQIERLRAAGADDYLTKPLDIPTLVERVRASFA